MDGAGQLARHQGPDDLQSEALDVRGVRQTHPVVRNGHRQQLLPVIAFGSVSQQPDSSGPPFQAVLDGVGHQFIDHERQRGGEVAWKLPEQP